MTDPRIDGWYTATNLRATFAFRVEGGEVVECAPYGRKIIMGLKWNSAYLKLEHGGFTIARLPTLARLPDPAPPDLDERAMRFGYLLSEIEVGARRLLDGAEPMTGLVMLATYLDEARAIFDEISREALDKVVEPTQHRYGCSLPLDHTGPCE